MQEHVSNPIQRKPRFSRILCITSIIIFLITLASGIYTTFTQTTKQLSIDLSFYAYAIPASAALAAATIGFNLNYEKAKKVCKEKLIFIRELYNLKK